jgi:hypothetical protein
MDHRASEGSKTLEGELHQEFLEAVAPALEGITEHCDRHASHAADALCPECGKLFCWSCMAFDSRRETLLCQACAGEKLQSDARMSWFRVARMPFIYVLLIVIAAFIAYTGGVGNPSAADLLAEDSGKSWHEMRAGLLWLRQAARAVDRAEQLSNSHANPEMKAKWAELAHTSMARARRSWRGTRPEWDLAIAEAVALANCGDPESALDVLVEIGPNLSRKHPAYVSFLFHRGNIALQNGDKAGAFADWGAVLDRSRSEVSDMMATSMMRLEQLLTANLEEEAMYQWIREECDTLMTAGAAGQRIDRIIAKHHLQNEFAGAMIFRPGQGIYRSKG